MTIEEITQKMLDKFQEVAQMTDEQKAEYYLRHLAEQQTNVADYETKGEK